MTERNDAPPFGAPLYKVGRGPDQAEWLVGPALGLVVGVLTAFKTDLVIGFAVGLIVGLGMLVLTAASGRDRRRDADGAPGGDAGPIFDGSSTRHFDACHSDGSDGGGDGDGDGGGGGD